MVPKQGWKLLTKPHSLVSRFFKASLWKARDVLWMGCRWSIRDGSQIRVLNEPGIRGSKDVRLGGPYPQVAKEILNVPLVEDMVVNGLVWNEDNNGEYSVSTGYRLWRNSLGYHSNCKVVGNWENLWNIMAPPRVKHLLWRICRGSNIEDRKDACTFAMMVEVIWKNRNNIVWNYVREGVAWDIGSMSSIEAGSLALKEVVQHVVTMNLDYVIFQSDSQVVTQGIHSIATNSSEFNFILLSIKRLLAFCQ
ncbi:uncharacterized protein LOC131657600 [Vicia villosa]|uniref:uncharacterized protein LOC131657600 n=1 Tax=Vicia villosa TaxID=3911 RepID=UPI00273C82DB|nr:uncharacterized protein LOC131657600 [Vicia villosa]